MSKPENPHRKIEILRASLEQKPIMANLLELYSYDFCDFIDLEIGLDGRFGYRDLDLYWTDPERFPFLLYVDSRLAGFVLIKASRREGAQAAGWDVAEFFVLRGYRRQGVGKEAAHWLWRSFPGRWEVRVMESNQPGYGFWQRAIESFTGDGCTATRYRQAGKDWHRFSFASNRKAEDWGVDQAVTGERVSGGGGNAGG